MTDRRTDGRTDRRWIKKRGDNKPFTREHSGSVVESLTRDIGATVGASLASLCCVLEQDTFILVLVQPRKTHWLKHNLYDQSIPHPSV